MLAIDFDYGDGFNHPRISGYEVLFERIVEDMAINPENYAPSEIALIDNEAKKPADEHWREVMKFIDEWCDKKTEEPDFLESYW